MTHGGARPGAGRRKSGPDSVQVNWRVSAAAKEWIGEQSRAPGENTATIIDRLIQVFEDSRL